MSDNCCKNSKARATFPLITVGHGTATAEALAHLLRGSGVTALVDVRTVPKSLRHPQFRQDGMQEWVPRDAGASYRWEPALGGFRKPQPGSLNVALRHPAFRGYADYMQTQAFQKALDTLLHGAAGEQTAILCSESLWWRCHRRLIADAASLIHNVEVLHLMHDAKLRPHIPTEGVRVTGDRQLRYDATSI